MKAKRSLRMFAVAGALIARVAGAAASAEPKSDVPPFDPAAEAEQREQLRQTFGQTRDVRVGLSAARAFVDAGQWLEAAALYREVLEVPLLPDAPAELAGAKKRAHSERETLMGRIPAVLISVESDRAAAVRVFVNGVPIQANELGKKYAVNPGTVRVRGVLDGTRLETVVEVREAELKPVRLVFEPDDGVATSITVPARTLPGEPRAKPSLEAPGEGGGDGQRLMAYLAFGVGGASLLTGGVFGVLALRDEATLEGRCPDDRCSAAFKSDVDSYESRKTIATVGLAAGAVLGATGVVLYLTAGGDRASQTAARWGLFYDGQQAGVRGEF